MSFLYDPVSKSFMPDDGTDLLADLDLRTLAATPDRKSRTRWRRQVPVHGWSRFTEASHQCAEEIHRRDT